MRSIVLTTLFLCLAASALPVIAQEIDEATATRRKALMKIMPLSFGMTVQMTADGKTLNSMFIENGDEPDFQQFIGTTDEQYQEFSDYMLANKEIVRGQSQPLMEQIAAENDPGKIAELAATFQANVMALVDNAEAKAAEILTPEQVLKIRELELHKNKLLQEEGFPIYNFEAYTALNLTEEQTKQLHETRDGFHKEQADLIARYSKAMPKPGENLDKQAMEQRMKQIQAVAEEGKKLTARIVAKTQSILTRDQMAKLDAMLKTTPECFTNMLKRQGTPPPKIDEKKYADWQKAWKPGDPIPKDYRQHEKARRRPFP